MIPQIGYIQISRCAPRVKVTMGWGCDEPLGSITMYMKRVGEPAEFAAYPPISVEGSELLFQFDELLFSRLPGRYEGRLTVGAREYKRLHFEMVHDDKILSVGSA